MYSGEYDACDVTLSVYPHRASLKNHASSSVKAEGGSAEGSTFQALSLVLRTRAVLLIFEMLRGDYMGSFQPGLNFNPVNRTEIVSR
jgi:hypothetical protein